MSKNFSFYKRLHILHNWRCSERSRSSYERRRRYT